MKIYELLVFDAEDAREFSYYSERLFFSTPNAAEHYYTKHFNSPNLFWKIKEYCLDTDEESKTVAGNWNRDNLVSYYEKT